jgi:hypothetical protein
MHKQAGYQFSELPEGHDVISLAILHGTTVYAKRTDGSVLLNHGGYITRSTVKAMNAAQLEGRTPFRVNIKKGVIVVTLRGEEIPFGDSDTLEIRP